MLSLRRCVAIFVAGGLVCGLSARSAQSQEEPLPVIDPATKAAAGQLIQQLFRATLDAVEGNRPDDPLPAPGEQRLNLDPVDERAAVDREQRAQLQRAQRLLDAGELTAGVQLLQHLLAADGDSLVLGAGGQWRSLLGAAEESILRGPPNVLAEYRRLYAAEAAEALRQARTAGTMAALGNVARQYFATTSGEIAANELGTRLLDAGHLADAAYWYQRLIDAASPLAQNAAWRRRAASALSPTARARGFRTPVVSEWRQPFGNGRHVARAENSHPVLIQRWTQPLTVRPANVQLISQLQDDLVDRSQPCIPAAVPLVVDGTLLFRTLRGVSAVDAVSGRPLWETPEDISVERLLAGESAGRPTTDVAPTRLRPMPRYDGNNPEHHTLANLLFRDGVSGLLTSDGEQVFVLEDHATLSYRPPGHYRNQPPSDDPHGRDWGSNRLAAYELKSGRRAWLVGGPKRGDELPDALEGTFFHGPPVVEGDELFAIGEQHGAEVLIVLDRRTGQPKWTQMLSGVSAEIQYDLVRRWWPAMPAVGSGIIVCPTTSGWVVAVDRHTRRIRWGHRLTERRHDPRHVRQADVAMTGPLDARWWPAAPILAGDAIIVTPSELPDTEYYTDPFVVCLDVRSGAVKWRHSKDDGLFLGAVVDGSVLIVGRNAIMSRSVADGRRLWEQSFPNPSDVPSGRGIVTGDDYLQPLHSGGLCRIRLSDGACIEHLTYREGARPLGNLVLADRRLFSLNAFEVTCFEDRRAMEQLASQPLDAPYSPFDRVQVGEWHLIEGRPEATAAIMREIDRSVLDPGTSLRARSVRQAALKEIVRSDLSTAVDALEELAEIAENDQERLEALHLKAARQAATGALNAAFDIYWSLAQSPQSTLVDSRDVSVRLDCWLAAQLQGLWAAMSGSERAHIDEQVAATLKSLEQNPDTDWSWWAEILAFHAAGRDLELRLADDASSAGRLAEAEIHLLRLIDRRHPVATRFAALQRLSSLLEGQDRDSDVAWFIANVSATLGEDTSAEASQLRLWAAQRLAARGGVRSSQFPGWTSDAFSLSRTGSGANRPVINLPLLQSPSSVPSLRDLQFVLQLGLGRIRINSLSGQRVWEAPLRAQPLPQVSPAGSVSSVGQLLFVVHQDVLHGLSLADRETLWQIPLEARALPSDIEQRPSSVFQEMVNVRSLLARDGVADRGMSAGPLAAWTPESIYYLGRSQLVAADPLTGRTQWVRKGIPSGSLVRGNREHVFVIPPSPLAAFALRADDGSFADVHDLPRSIESAIGVTDDGLVTLQTNASDDSKARSNDMRLQVIELATGQASWHVDFPDGTLFLTLPGEELLALAPDGALRLVNWSQRQVRNLGSIDPHLLRQALDVYAVADRRQVYLSLCGRHFSESLPSLPVNGPLIAFDREEGGVLWRSSISDQHLILEHLDHLPVLLLQARQSGPIDPGLRVQQVHVQMLDKRTGQQLLDVKRSISLGGFRSVDFDLTARRIDFEGYRERLRIQPSDREPAAN
ncbi:MAG: PQQ-binding-like beta-propeller repeat protein [Planctomycetaceae bacterium]|nr:PQQ-binding-like beta-propeller repeat protein [Planctomycetaceae bacterium]